MKKLVYKRFKIYFSTFVIVTSVLSATADPSSLLCSEMTCALIMEKLHGIADRLFAVFSGLNHSMNSVSKLPLPVHDEFSQVT